MAENSILYASMAETKIACLAYSQLQTPGLMSTFQLPLFQNLQILGTIASGHDVICTPASFSIWGLL